MISPQAILNNLKRLLLIEYNEEKKEFASGAKKVGLSRLGDRGEAWLNVRIERSYYNSLNQRCVEVVRKENDEEEDHHFEYGRQVAFVSSTGDPGVPSKIIFTGTVSFAETNRMVVVVSESAQLSLAEQDRQLAVMLSFDETTYQAMFDAIDRTLSAKGRLGELRDLLYSKRKASTLSLPPFRFSYLNDSQAQAVNKVLAAKDIAIVHGPPGTGKTTTLVEAINETLRRESQVLVCAQSNMAVDWISEKLVDRGINVLRIGNPSRVNDKMLSFTYERRFESHPDYPDLWKIRKNIRDIRAGKGKKSEQTHQKLDRLRARATELEIRINNDLFNSVHVIASTLTGSNSKILSGMKFSSVFVDEAAQALEAATLIPLRRAGRIILAGDHCQLPPTVKSFEAMKQGLGISLMERLVEYHPEAVSLLNLQYRMNEQIMAFSSRWFYNNEMEAAPEVRYRGILDYDTPIEWIDTDQMGEKMNEYESEVNSFKEEIVGISHGKINKGEARITLNILNDYISKIGRDRFHEERLDIGIISPYKAQVKYLRCLINKNPDLKPFRKNISINTVDGFQGQERDIILVSLVRSNDDGEIGFLRDLRRMNVAMTRARMKLIIIGDASTLGCHPFYRKLREHIKQH